VIRLVRFLLTLIALLAGHVPATAQAPLRVAAASDLQSVLPALTARFKSETGRAVDLSFGSSGNFFAQLQNGAPFDVFFSADIDYPKRL
jgi:molybdate transport system substrate-binding protein